MFSILKIHSILFDPKINLFLDVFRRLTEEATNGNMLSPNARSMSAISRAAFEVDDYWRIVDILHKRLINLLVLYSLNRILTVKFSFFFAFNLFQTGKV